MNGQTTTPTSPTPFSSSLAPDHGPSVTSKRSEKAQNEAVSSPDPGTLNLRESGISYVQSVHWEAILTKIRGLKDDTVTADAKAPRGSHLFYGPNRHATRDEVQAAVPARQIVDRLMALHFDSYMITPCRYIQAFFPPQTH